MVHETAILHSKYLFYKVKQYFQEINRSEIIMDYCGGKIIIDADSYFHVLFRHYAKDIKTYQSDKSYHSDQNIDPDNIPTELEDIINDYFQNISCSSFNESRIYVEINNITYAIWFKKIEIHKKGQPKETALRVQTFYPVNQQNEVEFVEKLNSVPSISGRTFYA